MVLQPAPFRLLNGVDDLANLDCRYSRDDKYNAGATLRAVSEWCRIVSRDSVATVEERGLAPKKPVQDRKLMLGIRNVDNVEELRRSMRKLLPMYAER